MAVGGPERIAEMVASLQVGSHAAHPPVPDHAVATEALGRVSTPGVPAQVLPAVAVLVEDHGMQVDLPAAPSTRTSRAGRPGMTIRSWWNPIPARANSAASQSSRSMTRSRS